MTSDKIGVNTAPVIIPTPIFVHFNSASGNKLQLQTLAVLPIDADLLIKPVHAIILRYLYARFFYFLLFFIIIG
jgi:hypothetical protein